MSRFRIYSFSLLAGAAMMVSAQTLPPDHYLINLKNYNFRNTSGIADTPHKLKSMQGHEDPDNWTMPTKADLDALKAKGINVNFPDFSFLEVTDAEGKTQLRQRTHTVEHVVYAIPGDAISLYPYYGLDEYYNFNENFSHWYDFYNGGRVKYSNKDDGSFFDLLSFPTVRTDGFVDHDNIQISDKFGFYGGVYMTPGTKDESVNGGQALIDNNVNNRNTDNDHHCKAGTSGVFFFPKMEGVDALPQEYVIAADFSQTFQLQNHLNVEKREIIEPLIAIRHLFKVRDGKNFADKVSGSLELNREYIRKNRRFVTARENEDFQIRLQFPLPTGWGTSGGITNFYYKSADGTYKRISRFTMRVLNGDTRKLWDSGNEWAEVDFHFGADISMYRAIPEGNSGLYPVNQEQREFRYHTMLTSGKRTAGHYIVQVIGKDDDGNPIRLSGEDGSSDWLVMMEYDITFVPSSGAFIVNENDLYTQEAYAKGRDANLKKRYGDPLQKIDFDEYAKINRIKDNPQLRNLFLSSATYAYNDNDRANPFFVSNTTPTTNGMEKTFFKWPVLWDLSSYSFGYNYRHDYNMYMLATHSDNVPYHASADKWNGNVLNDGNGLFDRLYYKTKRQNEDDKGLTPVEQGYFYYVNAATDPGVSARLNFRIPCPGYRVVVSAWVAEFSPIANAELDETSNISFNFVAVMNNGDRIVLHNFITGYLPETGKWLNVYYSFVPRLSEFYSDTKNFNDVDHFELELAHNGKKSSGADYAIDDIRAYVIPPSADAELPDYLCDADTDNVEVTLTTSFEALMQTLGLPESYTDDQDQFDLYYAFIDKSRFDRVLEETENTSTAFDAAVVNLSEVKGKMVSYGKILVDSYYKGNESMWKDDGTRKELVQDVAYRNEAADGSRLITFTETLPSGALRPGKEYYVAYKSSIGASDVPGDDPGSFFDIAGECAYRCVISVTPNNVIKIDGVLQADASDITVCENQSPAIQVNIISKKNQDGETVQVKNARFDWFNGTLGEYEKANDGTDSHTLRYALQVFRAIYPYAESLYDVVEGVSTPEGDETLQKWMIEILRDASTPAEDGAIAKLTLRQASFVLPPVDLADNQKSRKVYVTAIPIPDEEYDENYKWCISPTEIGVNIANKTPLLLHGLKDMTYPKSLLDVPLRIGLEQLYSDVNATADSRLLEIPVRLAGSTDKSISHLELFDESDIVLVQTNDPQYRHLGTIDVKGDETEKLLWIGEIKSLVASTDVSAQGNNFQASFDKSFRFKEGYFYRMRFNFREKKEGSAPTYDASAVVCPGQDVFTLKIVPKYLLWKGGDNLNFNNDANWMRVHTDTLSAVTSAAAEDGRHRHFATNGANVNSNAYSPLGFTYVVVKNDCEAPYLFKPSGIDPSVMDAIAAAQYGDLPDSGISENPDHGVGKATPLIQYDMAAYLSAVDNGSSSVSGTQLLAKCEKWQANRCKEIHFRPGATVLNQQELVYEKAWVDVELDAQRWYTVSSPLQEVFAGDFYLPSASGRENSELFGELSFDYGTHNRFNPAVYQRGWDKSSAKVYEIDKPGLEKYRNVIVKANWSNVFNDVTESYGGGVGFSIKSDVSAMFEANRPEKVLFRLPKADSFYDYYDQEGATGHNTTIERSENQYKLNPGTGTISSSTKCKGRYFLVGNPFMTYMDISKFLDNNKNLLEQKFWIVTGTGQIAGTIGEGGVVTTEPAEAGSDMTAIAPMQGFFVKSLEETDALNLSYAPSMMRRYAPDKSLLSGVTRAQHVPSMLKITAFNDGIPSSSAIIATGYSGMEMRNVEAIDNRGLELPSVVYTITDSLAQSICFIDDPDGVEIGMAADPGTETVIRFDGVEAFSGLALLDKDTFSLTELYDGMEIRMEGAAVGRFFLTAASKIDEVYSGLEWSVDEDGFTAFDRSGSGHLTVNVFDTLGRSVVSQSSGSDSVRVDLRQGVYVVRIANGVDCKSVKIRI